MVVKNAAACTYELDDQLCIASVDSGWSAFAEANEAPELVPPGPLGRPVLDYVAGATSSHLYQKLFEHVMQSGRAVEFPFRCDSPDLRRFLEMEIRPGAVGGLHLRTRVVRLEPRAPAPLLQRSTRGRGDLLRMCSWCKAVDVGGRWCEVEQAMIALRIFEGEEIPAITHGICPRCEERMEEVLRA